MITPRLHRAFHCLAIQRSNKNNSDENSQAQQSVVKQRESEIFKIYI